MAPTAKIVTLTDLVSAYFRFCDWIDVEPDMAFHCVRELQALQQLFGTRYVVFPPPFFMDDQSVRALVETRSELLREYLSLLDFDPDEGPLNLVKVEIEKSAYRLTTGHLLTWATTFVDDSHAQLPTASCISEDAGFDETSLQGRALEEAAFREVIIAEHPHVIGLSFPASELIRLGVPVKEPPNFRNLTLEDAYRVFYEG